MGKEAELFKAAQTGNNALLERAFATYLKKNSGGGGGHGFGSVRGKAHPNIQDDQGYTLLHHATLQGLKETVNLLLRCGASTTISDNSGSCPLHLAAWKGDLEIVKMLVTQGPSRANVNQQNDSEDSALHLASQYGFSEVVEFLLQRHADPLLLNVKAESALDLAAQYGHIDTVHLLISHCPEMLYMQRAGFSPLHLAARNGHTVVALSLINAGISVNTVCDSGSALHEAAVCGKEDTVELLLDKGVNLDLKDGRGQTVLEVLDQYTAEKAVKIKNMIQEHKSSGRGSNSPPPPGLQHQNIVAIAQTNCLPVVEESSALAFKRGDTIVVLEKKGETLFTGTCHGKIGSFLAEDVTFYCKRNGELVATDVSSLACGSPVRAERQLDGVMTMVVSTKDPYEDIPGFPVSNSPERVPVETSATPTNIENTNTSDSRSSVPMPTESTLQPVTAKSRADKKRMSKKDKIFQLSKDTGAYSELSPINPMEAQKEYGESLILNPVGPAFGSTTTATENGQILTAHNSAPKASEDQPKFQGSYYVLEVGNFDRDSRITVSPPVEVSPPADNASLQPGYYMLDIENFSPKEQSGTLPRPSQYKNVVLNSNSVEDVALQSTPTPPSQQSQFSPTPPPQSPPPPTISEPSIRDSRLVPKSSSGSTNRISAPPMYENIMPLGEDQAPPLPKKTRSRTALEAAAANTVSNEKRSSLRRRNMVYEALEIGAGKKKSGSNYSTPTTSPIPISEPESVSDSVPAESSSTSLARISTSKDPFAGLVMSSSVAVGDSVPSVEMLGGAGGSDEFRNRTETVWDNERVEMEWNQIDTLLRDISVPTAESPPPTDTLSSWLVRNGLGTCLHELETNGFDSLCYLGGNILVMDDLADIGITSPDDQYNLMAAVALLPPPPRLGHVTSVSEWLELLELSYLEPKFMSYTLERLSTFWEVELAAVVGVEEMGYRKRLQYGISELRSGHPEWLDNPTRTPQTLPAQGKSWSTSSLHALPSQNSPMFEIRPPSLAQTVLVGKGHRTAKLPSTTWKHSNEVLIKSSITYQTKYLGSVIVKQLHGEQSAEEACLRLKSSTETMQKKPEIILAISWKGVKFVNSRSRMIISTHAIPDVTYCSPDIEDRRIFSYITKDKLSGKHYAHVFMAETQEVANDIRMTIAQAIEICYQKVMKARSKLSTMSQKSLTKNNHSLLSS